MRLIEVPIVIYEEEVGGEREVESVATIDVERVQYVYRGVSGRARVGFASGGEVVVGLSYGVFVRGMAVAMGYDRVRYQGFDCYSDKRGGLER